MREANLKYSIVIKDQASGLGVMSRQAFEVGEKIDNISGVVETEIQQHSLQVSPGQHIIDLNFAGYLLHSCDPNVIVDMFNLTVHALRPIKENEFLYMDYSETEDTLYRQFQCQCGADNCRGWITGREEVAYSSLIAAVEVDQVLN